MDEFKKFIMRGNVLDLAVGVIIGGAFGKIVTSLVNDILMPVIGVILGGLDFTGLSFKIKDAEILYGSFIQNVIDFLIVAFCIFIFVKTINRVMNQNKAYLLTDSNGKIVLDNSYKKYAEITAQRSKLRCYY